MDTTWDMGTGFGVWNSDMGACFCSFSFFFAEIPEIQT